MIASPDRTGVYAEILEPQRAASHQDAWRDLSARALEANVFAEQAFVLSALCHFAQADRLRLLFLWQDGSKERLIGVVVFEFPRAWFGFGVARVWHSEQAGLAALLLDREAAASALEAVMEWIARERPNLIGLFLPSLDATGPTSAAVHALKEWGRQMRRLRERGEIAVRLASDSASVEKFLALEAKGWKGAQRTALGADVGLAAFTRSMLASLAREDKLSIYLLELDGEAVAAGVMLRSGDRAFYWKTTYEESYAEYSPGLQLTLELSRAQQRDATIATTDSCAIEGHPMIERIWTARLELVDCLIATRPGPARRLMLWLAGETARRRLKEFAKRAINPLRGRKRS